MLTEDLHKLSNSKHTCPDGLLPLIITYSNRTNDDPILSASGTGNVVVNSDMKFNDNDKLLFGNDDDLEIFPTLVMATLLSQENTGGNSCY